MVLADLGRKITSAFADLNRTPLVDEKALDALLKDLCSALLSSDVNVKLVSNLRTKVKAKVAPQLEKLAAAPQKQKQLVQKAVFDELVALVDPSGAVVDDAKARTEYTVWTPKKAKTNVVMFVGLQGAGKTTSCTKLAVHYQRKGYKTALVCADTFRAGAFDQLKQNATKAKIPFFGSYTETDPSVIAAAGVVKFKKERFEVIIVDTSGRHRQEAELFEEMKQIARGIQPDMTIMVLDGAIGQAAEAQSRAFKEAAGFGAIIVTKMDGHAKGGGAISAVAATKTPIIFIGTGEHLHDLERFSPGPFVSKMLGMGDLGGFLEHLQDLQQATPAKKQEEMRERMERGVFTVRDLKDQMTNISKMGPLSKIASMIPGMSNMMGAMGGDDDAAQKMRRMLFIFDAMSTEELDSDGSIFQRRKGKKPAPEGEPREPHPRVLRIARGSGTSVDEVEGMLVQHAMFSTMVKNAGGKRKWEQQQAQKQAREQASRMGPKSGGRMKQQQITLEQLVKMPATQRAQVLRQAPPQVRQQIEAAGGVEAAYAMSQRQPSRPSFGDPAAMQRMMEQMGGMGNLARMFGQ